MNFSDPSYLPLLDEPQNLDTEVDFGLSAEADRKGSYKACKNRGLLITRSPWE